jgi:ribosomal protein S12 methylthiotransferase accessory factor
MTSKIVFKDAYKTFTADQDKVLPPEETVRRFKERLQHVDLDILEETVRIDNGRLGIPVFFSRCGKDAAALTGTKKQMGKGATPQQAEASAVMELAERFSFFSFVNTPANFKKATFDQVGDRAIAFETIARSVHDNSTDLDAARRIFEKIPIRWTSAYNLTAQREVMVPFDWFYAINEFNGPSAGNCQEEALLQGICEIVERHVSALVSRNHICTPGIRPHSARDKAVVEMTEKYEKAGIHFYLSDFTLDMGIPSVGMLAYDPATFPVLSEIVWTAGTTPDPEKALSRTMTEVAQLAGDFNTGANFVASGLPKFYALQEAEYVTNPRRMINIQDLPNLSDDNIRVEVENCLAVLRDRGFEVHVINTRHAQLDIPAFYTIIPGAHFRERAAGTSVGMFSTKLIFENLAPERALEQLKTADRLLPQKYYIHFYLGATLIKLGRPGDARRSLEHALKLEPAAEDAPSIYSYLGICHKDLGHYREALRVLEKGVALDKERTDIYNLMGFCHYQLKEHAQAIDCFQRVINLNPNSAIDYANIGSNYREIGDCDKAIEYYRLALEVDPRIEFARENLVRLGVKTD